MMVKKILFLSLSMLCAISIKGSAREEAVKNSSMGDLIEVIQGKHAGKRGRLCGMRTVIYRDCDIPNDNLDYPIAGCMATKEQKKDIVNALKVAPGGESFIIREKNWLGKLVSKKIRERLEEILAIKGNDGFQGVFHSSYLEKIEPAEVTQIRGRDEQDDE